jgi:hypothetical protein
MDDTKRAAREAEVDAKKAWRNRDGEDLADKVGNLGDEAHKDLGNLGDVLRHRADEGEDALRNRRESAIDDPRVEPIDSTRPY